MKNKLFKKIIPLTLSALLLFSCNSNPDPYTELFALTVLEDEAVALSDSPAAELKILTSVPAGILTHKSDKAVIDYSNTSDGYVMVKYTAETAKRLKAQVKGENISYTYNINAGEWTTFPLAEGDGKYTVTIFINAKDSKYATVLSKSFDVKLNDEFSPFLYPNQYVDYSVSPKTVEKAAELTENLDKTLDKVAAVYDYTVENITYDTEKAKTVKSGYLPSLDKVLEEKKGICFDYAALMAGMLRSQNIPCKLVVGYAGKTYHAWISVYSPEEGWIDGVIKFDGKSWQRMDPTFASSANKSKSIMSYIGDGKNYTEKYLY